MISDNDLLTYTRAHEDDLPTLRNLERAAIATIQKQTGRYFGPEAEIVESVRWRGNVLPLSNEPIDGVITSIESWDGSAFNVESSLSYFVHGSSIIVSPNPYTLFTAPAQFRVTYQAGYPQLDDPDAWEAPENIRQAVLLYVTYYYDKRDGEDHDAFKQAFDSLISADTRLAA